MREEKDFKNLYDCLKESKDLKMIHKGLSGEWEEDKKVFIKFQKELEKLANGK